MPSQCQQMSGAYMIVPLHHVSEYVHSIGGGLISSAHAWGRACSSLMDCRSKNCDVQIGEYCRECSLNYYSFDGKTCLACPYGAPVTALWPSRPWAR